jgi:hypothetical protein
MGDAGADAFTLAAIFGWSDIRMAMRYTHAVEAVGAHPEPDVKMQQLKFHVTGA